MKAIISEIDPRDAYFDVRHKLIGRIVEIPDMPLHREFSGPFTFDNDALFTKAQDIGGYALCFKLVALDSREGKVLLRRKAYKYTAFGALIGAILGTLISLYEPEISSYIVRVLSKWNSDITDLFYGVVRGTNDEAAAKNYALCSDFFVADSQEGFHA